MPINNQDDWSVQDWSIRPENTMVTCLHRTAKASLERLKTRYADIDFEQCLIEACMYIRSKGNQNNILDDYRICERALYPDTGAVGSRAKTLEAFLYYWRASNDESQDIPADTETRKLALIRALKECQRGNNLNSANINPNDDGRSNDAIICTQGTFNKIAETFVGLHPCVDIIVNVNDRIYQTILGFLSEAYYSIPDETRQSPQHFLEHISKSDLNSIKRKTIRSLGGKHSFINPNGLVGSSEDRYIKQSLKNIIYFTIPDKKNASKLIAEANLLLDRESSNHSGLSVLRQSSRIINNTTFNYRELSRVLTARLPAPPESSYTMPNNSILINFQRLLGGMPPNANIIEHSRRQRTARLIRQGI